MGKAVKLLFSFFFSSNFPLGEGKLWKWKPAGGIADKTALETQRVNCLTGKVVFILQKMKKIKGKT